MTSETSSNHTPDNNTENIRSQQLQAQLNAANTELTANVSITHGYDGAGGIVGNFDSGATVDDTTPTLHGKTTPNGSLWIYVDNVLKGAVKADASGDWNYTLSGLSNGSYSISAALMDSWVMVAKSADFIINVGVASVQAPVITAVLDDVGAVTGHLGQNGSTDDVRPEVVGTAEAGRLVNIYDGTQLLGSTVADASGNWRYALESDLGHGTHKLMAEALDVIGNISGKSNPWTISVGTNTSAVSITHGYDGAGGIVGNFDSGATVDDTTPTLHGKTTPNGSLWIYVDNVLKGAVKADASGDWNYTLSGLDDGPHTISAALMNGWAMAAKSADFFLNVDTSPVQAEVATAHDTSDVATAGAVAGSNAALNASSPEEPASLASRSSKTLKLSVGDVLEQNGQDLFQYSDDVPMPANHGMGATIKLDEALSDSMGSSNWGAAGKMSADEATSANHLQASPNEQLLAQQEVLLNLV